MRVLCRNSDLNYYQVNTLLFYFNAPRSDLERRENINFVYGSTKKYEKNN